MLSLTDENQVDIIEAFTSTSRYLDDPPNISLSDLQLNKAVFLLAKHIFFGFEFISKNGLTFLVPFM